MKIQRELTVTEDFCAAHRLIGYEGKCAHLHGHNYHVEVQLRGQIDDRGLFIADFSDIKKLIRELDHTTICWNGDTELIEAVLTLSRSKTFVLPEETTVEHLSEFFARKILKMYPEMELVKVSVHETSKNTGIFQLINEHE